MKLERKQAGLAELSDSLKNVRAQYGIFNPGEQGRLISGLISKTESKLINTKAKLGAYKNQGGPQDSIRKLSIIVTGLESEFKNLTTKLNNYNNGSSQIVALGWEESKYSDQLIMDKERYKQLKSSYESPFNALHLVQEAEVPVIKSRPKRSLIVIGVGFIATILSMLWVLLTYQYRNKGWQRAFQD